MIGKHCSLAFVCAVAIWDEFTKPEHLSSFSPTAVVSGLPVSPIPPTPNWFAVGPTASVVCVCLQTDRDVLKSHESASVYKVLIGLVLSEEYIGQTSVDNLKQLPY